MHQAIACLVGTGVTGMGSAGKTMKRGQDCVDRDDLAAAHFLLLSHRHLDRIIGLATDNLGLVLEW